MQAPWWSRTWKLRVVQLNKSSLVSSHFTPIFRSAMQAGVYGIKEVNKVLMYKPQTEASSRSCARGTDGSIDYNVSAC